jgi:hypothetical protein
MILKKLLSATLLLATATILLSQRAPSGVDSLGVDSLSVAQKIGSITSDTYHAAKRVEKKAGTLVSLSNQARMQKQLRSRINIDVSEIPVKELPVVVDSIKVDPPAIPAKNKFWFWRR